MSNRRKRCDIPANMMVGFLGAGRMAQAMARGLITGDIFNKEKGCYTDDGIKYTYNQGRGAGVRSNYWVTGVGVGIIQPSNIWASDPDPTMLKFIQTLGVTTTSKNEEVIKNTQVVFIAVKPNVVSCLLDEIYHFVNSDKLLVSIAAGIRLASIEERLPQNTRVVRVMPNTPALVQAGAAVLAPGKSARAGDNDLVVELLSCVGICEEATEESLDAVTGLSGSGPAYAFAAIEALSDGGVKMGLPRSLSTKLAAQTLLGAAKMVLETGKHPGQLKDEVCSPGGTTITAMHTLEKAGFRAALMDAVEAATRHSQSLSKNS